jgi:RNA polymerase sigma factor (TIGR02999 family)
MGAVSSSVADLMSRFRQGDRAAAGDLVQLFYPQLKQIAAARMKTENPRHTWQPTVLVNELYLELLKIRAMRPGDADDAQEKAAFLQLSAHLMRRLLIHHSRPLSKQVAFQNFDERINGETSGFESLRQIDDALDRLGELNPALRSVVELRVFEGLTGDEIAARMACSPRSVARYWNFARDWLAHEFGPSETS